jgi:hypothetical protein
MKTSIAAVQSIPTHELKELADAFWQARRPRPGKAASIASAENWQLAEAAEQLVDQQKRTSQDAANGQNLQETGSGTVRVARRRGLLGWIRDRFRRLFGADSQANNLEPAREQQNARTEGRDSAVADRSPVTLDPSRNEPQPATLRGERKKISQDRSEKSRYRAELKKLNRRVREIVGETLIGKVSLEMVLAELERRGNAYIPPIRSDGTLIIQESDLTSDRVDGFRKVRPGIEKLLQSGEYRSVRVEAASPVRIAQGIAKKGMEFRSSAPISIPALEAGKIVAPHIRSEGSIAAEQLEAGTVKCLALKATAVHVSNLRVAGDADVVELAVTGDIAIGSKLDYTRRAFAGGKASIGKLGDHIATDVAVQGQSLAEAFRKLSQPSGVLDPGADRAGVRRAGVEGAADDDILEAFESLQTAGRPISAGRLARKTKTNFHTAERWLKNNHPELLRNRRQQPVSVPDAGPDGSDEELIDNEEPMVISPAGNGMRV